ncbi:sensor histidine kinase [Mucilaginibacter sp. AK015]|uniref:sensor histidine kinase n=1 Tax=Mucilaginibacter sp. AK015 TaxID=2723072 RepID=UPI001618B7F6|nr:sensor histidine kinase [Mucilaginibacter sp. AK015]MBB5394150.1 hypothetical protein [Mucilaginibacter sp. AK015]
MRKTLLHLIFWAVFFLMWNRIMYFYVDNRMNRLYFTGVDVALVASAFYIVYLYIMPDYLRRKSMVKLVLFSAVLIAVLSGIYSLIMLLFLREQLVPIHFDFTWNYEDLQYNRFFIALVGVLAGCSVKIIKDRQDVSRRLFLMEKEKSIAELSYLKAQINPHFLFNSLNNLHAQIELDAADAKSTLVSLSELLRYQLYDCNADLIALNKELAYLKNYFNLQSIRKDNCSARLSVSGNYDGLRIAPLLLIPFVENAFKYVSDHDGRDNFIKADISLQNKQLLFWCSNTFNVESQSEADRSNKGIGLINVRKRLQLIYGNNHSLTQEIANGVYTVKLTLKLM